ncbi:hypothetical protein HK100_005963 [Physocladia obscura]|uniref:Uncharacterized protein n=1 Tax=Physocladia obscura TaxID=109957 RepID=A0AAD5T682_9FUNG|nr:hypothetical protein HK100_005963 [Physocladia obscura]
MLPSSSSTIPAFQNEKSPSTDQVILHSSDSRETLLVRAENELISATSTNDTNDSDTQSTIESVFIPVTVTLVVLPIRYNDSEGKFFDEERPTDLEGMGYDRVMRAALERFTREDEMVNLKWISSVKEGQKRNLFSLKFSKSEAEIPWQIIIKFTDKRNSDSEFLPAYAPPLLRLGLENEFLIAGSGRNSTIVAIEDFQDSGNPDGRFIGGRRCPSYKTNPRVPSQNTC